MHSLVIHYKELALNVKNRPWFVKLLIRNLRTTLKGLNITSVRSVMGRLEVECGPSTPLDEVRERLRLE